MRKECFICGRRGQGVEEHHAVPQRRGGSDSPENLYPLCGSCHNAVEKIYDDAFYERLGLAEARVEAFERADGEIGGRKVGAKRSLDRRLPLYSPHVVFDFTILKTNNPRPFEEFIHCGYCNSAFAQWEHAQAAQHLRIVHRVEDPYETVDMEEREFPTPMEGMPPETTIRPKRNPAKPYRFRKDVVTAPHTGKWEMHYYRGRKLGDSDIYESRWHPDGRHDLYEDGEEWEPPKGSGEHEEDMASEVRAWMNGEEHEDRDLDKLLDGIEKETEEVDD